MFFFLIKWIKVVIGQLNKTSLWGGEQNSSKCNLYVIKKKLKLHKKDAAAKIVQFNSEK